MSELPREIAELLAGYVLGDLEPDELEVVNNLLQTQPELQGEINRLQFTLSLIPLSLPEVVPPARLKSAILGKEYTSTHQTKLVTVGMIKQKWLWLWGGLVAMLTVGWLWDSYHLRQKVANLEQNQQQIASSNSKMLMLKSMDRSDSAWGVVAVEPKRGMAVVQIRNLEPVSHDKVYRLWVVSMNGKKIDCGEIRPNARGEVNVEFPLNETQLRSAQITLEPVQRSPQPTGPLIMQSEI